MSRIQKTIFPIFLFFIFLSVSTRTTVGEKSSDIDDKVHSFVDEGRSLQDEQDDIKGTIERIDLSMPQTNIQNDKEEDKSFKEEEEKNNDLSDNNETLINKNNEEINDEIERAVMRQYVEDLISNLSEYMKQENKEQRNHDENEQLYEKTENNIRNRLPKRHAISTDGCLLTEVVPAAVTSVSSTSEPSSVSTSSSLLSSFLTPLPLEVLEQTECAAEAIEYGQSRLLITIVHEILCEAKKLLHYLFHTFINLLNTISIRPEINLLEADVGTIFVEFLENAPLIVEELLKESQDLLAIPEILITAIPLEDIIRTINRLKEDFLLLLKRLYPVFSQVFEKLLVLLGKQVKIFIFFIDALNTTFLNLITSFISIAVTLLSNVQNEPVLIDTVKAFYDGASGIQEIFLNSQPSVSLSQQEEILPVIPLSSESTSSTAVTTTSTSETETVPIQEPLVPTVSVSPSTVGTSSSTSTTTSTVVSEPEILIEEIPSTITTTTTTTAAAAATAATGAVATAAASSSSSNQLNPISNIDAINVASSSSSSSSSTSCLPAQPELEETVASTATSTSSSSSTLPETSKVLFEPSFLSRVIPIISSISSGTKDLTSATSPAISSLRSSGNLLSDTTDSSSSASLPSIEPVISAVSPASSTIIDNYASPITRIKNILPVTSSSSAASTSSNPEIIVPSSPILNPFKRKFQTSSAAPVVVSSSVTTSVPESSGISSSIPLRFPWKLKWPVVLPRNKVIAAIGNNNLVPGDIVLVTLKSNKTYFSRVTDADSPLTFDFLKPKLVPEVFNTFGKVWRLVPGDFRDINCESLFNGIY